MAHSFILKDVSLQVGDTIAVDYRVKESDDKERLQQFKGILIAIKGESEKTRMITVRKIAKSGVGVERIFPVTSPFVASIALVKKSTYTKAKLYFLEDLSDQQLRQKLYKQKKAVVKRNANPSTKAKTSKTS